MPETAISALALQVPVRTRRKCVGRLAPRQQMCAAVSSTVLQDQAHRAF
jgi:hypothetical protein